MTQTSTKTTERHDHSDGPTFGVWVLQYGPCWCRSTASESGAFDYIRLRKTGADLGPLERNVLIVSDRVIDGSAHVFRQIYQEVPDPKLVISAGSCPFASRFWDELPNGWTDVEGFLPVDIRVDDCISGNPESLMAAMLEHALSLDESRTLEESDRSIVKRAPGA